MSIRDKQLFEKYRETCDEYLIKFKTGVAMKLQKFSVHVWFDDCKIPEIAEFIRKCVRLVSSFGYSFVEAKFDRSVNYRIDFTKTERFVWRESEKIQNAIAEAKISCLMNPDTER